MIAMYQPHHMRSLPVTCACCQQAADMSSWPQELVNKIAAYTALDTSDAQTELSNYNRVWAACARMPGIMQQLGHNPFLRYGQLRLLDGLIATARLHVDARLAVAAVLAPITVPTVTSDACRCLQTTCDLFMQAVRTISLSMHGYLMFMKSHPLPPPPMVDGYGAGATVASGTPGLTDYTMAVIKHVLDPAVQILASEQIDKVVCHARRVIRAASECIREMSAGIEVASTSATTADTQAVMRQHLDFTRSARDGAVNFDALGPLKDYIAAISKLAPQLANVAEVPDVRAAAVQLGSDAAAMVPLMVNLVIARAALVGVCGSASDANAIFTSLTSNGHLTRLPWHLRTTLTAVATGTGSPGGESGDAVASQSSQPSQHPQQQLLSADANTLLGPNAAA